MGWWKSQNGVIGDQPADIMGGAMKAIEQTYMREAGRLPTQGELADLIQFCSCGIFDVACGDVKYEFSRQNLGLDSTPRRCRRGAQGASGVANQPKPGEMGNVDPRSGDHYEAGELMEVLATEVKAAIEGPADES
jgi:hypothetical protein